jgi:hypothetical protein
MKAFYTAVGGGYIDGMETKSEIPAEWLADFEAASRRTLEQRMKYAFIKTYKPVMHDARYRSFETMAEYRRWCEENSPEWLCLSIGRVDRKHFGGCELGRGRV